MDKPGTDRHVSEGTSVLSCEYPPDRPETDRHMGVCRGVTCTADAPVKGVVGATVGGATVTFI